MRCEDIQKALEAACVVSNHHEFVVAGSLSVLGLIETPPERMSMSIDIDFYPLRDPGRASDIASVLGEDSDFHARHGYYLEAWSRRNCRCSLMVGVIALFRLSSGR